MSVLHVVLVGSMLVWLCHGSKFYTRVFARDVDKQIYKTIKSGFDITYTGYMCQQLCELDPDCIGFTTTVCGLQCQFLNQTFQLKCGSNQTWVKLPANVTAPCSKLMTAVVFGQSEDVRRGEMKSMSCDLKIPDLPTPITAGATSIYGNKLYVCGGCNYTQFDVSLAVCFTIGKDKVWRAAPQLNYPRALHRLATVGNKMIAIGGRGHGFSYGNTPEIYSPSLRKWVLTGWDHVPTLDNQCVVTISQTELLLIGGFANFIYQKVDKLNVETGNMTTVAQLTEVRCGIDCKLYNPTTVILAGGITPSYGKSAVVELLFLSTMTWKTLSPLTVPRSDHSIIRIDGFLAVIGGPTSANSLEVYDDVADSWTSHTMEVGWIRCSGTTFVLPCSWFLD